MITAAADNAVTDSMTHRTAVVLSPVLAPPSGATMDGPLLSCKDG